MDTPHFSALFLSDAVRPDFLAASVTPEDPEIQPLLKDVGAAFAAYLEADARLRDCLQKKAR
jgi:hypothetical protein